MKGIISFYEKPGCQGNARQKEKLRAAGYMLQVVDMISKKWDPADLLQFFGNIPIKQCVNFRAPIITNGLLDVDALSDEQLLDKMVAEPILIKRPLIFHRGRFGVGFDNDLVTSLLGEAQTEEPCHKNENCTHP